MTKLKPLLDGSFPHLSFPKLLVVAGVLVLVLLSLLGRIFVTPSLWWTEAVGTHEVIENDGTLVELWSRANVFAGYTSQKVTAAQGMIFIDGSLDQTKPDTVLAFDGTTGAKLWQLTDRNLDANVYATSDALYIGFTGNGQLGAYDLHTGQPYWLNRLPKSRSVIRLYVNDDLVHSESTFDIFHLVQASTGEVIRTIDGLSVSVMPTVEALAAVPETEAIEPEFFRNRWFTEQTEFQVLDGKISARDRQTGDVLWERNEELVSGIATSNPTIYFLTAGGKLEGINSRTGELVNSVQFTPDQFDRYHPNGDVRSFYVAVDEDSNLLYVLLGDSRQLFAFKII